MQDQVWHVGTCGRRGPRSNTIAPGRQKNSHACFFGGAAGPILRSLSEESRWAGDWHRLREGNADGQSSSRGAHQGGHAI
jgi:hypothetical protein